MFFELAFKLVFQVDIGICLLTGGGPATYPWNASWSGNVKIEQRDRCEGMVAKDSLIDTLTAEVEADQVKQEIVTIGSLSPSALRSLKFDKLMIDRSPKKSDKEVLSELERQLPNLPLGMIIEFHVCKI